MENEFDRHNIIGRKLFELIEIDLIQVLSDERKQRDDMELKVSEHVYVALSIFAQFNDLNTDSLGE